MIDRFAGPGDGNRGAIDRILAWDARKPWSRGRVFDYIAEHGIDPDVLIYMTDLEGPMPAEPPFPVIWAVENEGQVGSVPFGQPLVVDMI